MVEFSIWNWMRFVQTSTSHMYNWKICCREYNLIEKNAFLVIQVLCYNLYLQLTTGAWGRTRSMRVIGGGRTTFNGADKVWPPVCGTWEPELGCQKRAQRMSEWMNYAPSVRFRLARSSLAWPASLALESQRGIDVPDSAPQVKGPIRHFG